MAVSDIIKQTFASGLIELVEIKSFDKLTIQQICDHCGLGRQTFYNHFKDKYDLVQWIYNAKTQRLFLEYECEKNWSATIRKIFYHNIEFEKYYFNISKSQARDILVNYWIEHTNDYYSKAIAYKNGAMNFDKQLLHSIQFNSYAAVNMSFKWMQNGMRETPENMAEIMINNLPPILRDSIYK